MARVAVSTPITPEEARDLLRPHLARPDELEAAPLFWKECAEELNDIRQSAELLQHARSLGKHDRSTKVYAEATRQARRDLEWAEIMLQHMEAHGGDKLLGARMMVEEARQLVELTERARDRAERMSLTAVAAKRGDPLTRLSDMHRRLDAPFRPASVGAKSPTVSFVVDAMRAILNKHVERTAVAKALERRRAAVRARREEEAVRRRRTVRR